jgi:hypothetical protein
MCSAPVATASSACSKWSKIISSSSMGSSYRASHIRQLALTGPVSDIHVVTNQFRLSNDPPVLGVSSQASASLKLGLNQDMGQEASPALPDWPASPSELMSPNPPSLCGRGSARRVLQKGQHVVQLDIVHPGAAAEPAPQRGKQRTSLRLGQTLTEVQDRDDLALVQGGADVRGQLTHFRATRARPHSFQLGSQANINDAAQLGNAGVQGWIFVPDGTNSPPLRAR